MTTPKVWTIDDYEVNGRREVTLREEHYEVTLEIDRDGDLVVEHDVDSDNYGGGTRTVRCYVPMVEVERWLRAVRPSSSTAPRAEPSEAQPYTCYCGGRYYSQAALDLHRVHSCAACDPCAEPLSGCGNPGQCRALVQDPCACGPTMIAAEGHHPGCRYARAAPAPRQPSDPARWHLCRHDILKKDCPECRRAADTNGGTDR